MEPRTIKGSRWKSALFLAISLVFVAIGVVILRANEASVPIAWACILFFGLCAVVFVLRVVRPGTLRLDDDGFTVDDLAGRSHRTLWRDIGPFFLFRLPRGGDLIAYNYLPGHDPKSALLEVSRAMGADAGIAGLWSLPKKRLIVLLNDYRTAALAHDAAPPPA